MAHNLLFSIDKNKAHAHRHITQVDVRCVSSLQTHITRYETNLLQQQQQQPKAIWLFITDALKFTQINKVSSTFQFSFCLASYRFQLNFHEFNFKIHWISCFIRLFFSFINRFYWQHKKNATHAWMTFNQLPFDHFIPFLPFLLLNVFLFHTLLHIIQSHRPFFICLLNSRLVCSVRKGWWLLNFWYRTCYVQCESIAKIVLTVSYKILLIYMPWVSFLYKHSCFYTSNYSQSLPSYGR